MRFTVLSWNIGGAKFLEEKHRRERKKIRDKINKALITILNDPSTGPQPDVITLQEIVQYREPKRDGKRINDLIKKIPGYSYFPFKLIDSDFLSSKAKWNKVMGKSKDFKIKSDWENGTFFAQGNAFLIKNDAPHFPIWDLSNHKQKRPGKRNDHFMEHVHLDSGLYFGDRNTEPRAAIVAHFIYDPGIASGKGQVRNRKPLDIFVINLHLTTLMMEREGVPEIDAFAAKIRQNQLNVVFNGIVSRYNSWRQSGYLERNKPRKIDKHESSKRHSPVWIMAGDFNFTEHSAEYAFIKRMNFIDTVPNEGKISDWGCGTKAKGVNKSPTLNLDYIFAGPNFVSLDPAITLYRNRVIHDHVVRRASDHYPVLTSMDLIPS